MRKTVELGRVAGLRITAHQSVIPAGLALWLLLALIGLALLNLSLVESLVGGFIAVSLHYLSELVHQLGHAWAARRTGHPMIGIRYWMVLGASIYPKDEGELPASVHIRRALGGAPASLLLALMAGILTLLSRSASGSLIWWLAVFLFLDNLLVFTLGAFLPLGFTDGSTLLQWWGK